MVVKVDNHQMAPLIHPVHELRENLALLAINLCWRLCRHVIIKKDGLWNHLYSVAVHVVNASYSNLSTVLKIADL